MNPKPVLLWPRPASEIESRLGLAAAEFLVVDTNSSYELQKLSRITRVTPVFDPFPRRGAHYREFKDHIEASDCRFHINGLTACRSVSRALNDPSLARASMEELLAAVGPGDDKAWSRLRKLFDGSGLNWFDIAVAATLVLAASLIGNTLFLDNSLTAAVAAVVVFTVLYVAVRIVLAAAAYPRAPSR